MIKNLGYKNYMAQGGDWGATIANWIGYDHSKFCKALHINCLTMRHPDGPQSDDEKDWQKRFCLKIFNSIENKDFQYQSIVGLRTAL